ncbi:MAG: hypothetical protein M3530_07815 [Thermoproteota archaeon]|nr:hypothetical protein [Thermoproteota archaeon]
MMEDAISLLIKNSSHLVTGDKNIFEVDFQQNIPSYADFSQIATNPEPISTINTTAKIDA